MKRGIVIALVGLAVLAACSSAEDTQSRTMAPSLSTPSSTTITMQPPSPTIVGAVVIEDPADWEHGWVAKFIDTIIEEREEFEIPDSFEDGDLCNAAILSGLLSVRAGKQVVVKDGSGEIIGIGRLDVGEVAGLGPSGFDIPADAKTQDMLELMAGMREVSSCAFPFTIDLTRAASFYVVEAEGQEVAKYTHDELESARWVIRMVVH